MVRCLRNALDLPGQDTKNEVHDEEGTQDDHGDKVNELPLVAHGILNLFPPTRIGRERERSRRKEKHKQVVLRNAPNLLVAGNNSSTRMFL